MSKPDYHGKDFFQRQDFRGLLLADYQEAIGEKAFDCVDELNTNTVSQFNKLRSFKDSLQRKKALEKYYMNQTSKFSETASRLRSNKANSIVTHSRGASVPRATDLTKLSDDAQVDFFKNSNELGIFSYPKRMINTFRDSRLSAVTERSTSNVQRRKRDAFGLTNTMDPPGTTQGSMSSTFYMGSTQTATNVWLNQKLDPLQTS